MIRVCAVTKEHIEYRKLKEVDLQAENTWYWVDMCNPSKEEYKEILEEYFGFNEKVDHYFYYFYALDIYCGYLRHEF
jgi:Mg2+ and Co2+ transporter CorA